MKYILGSGKIKETFYQANVVCGEFFNDSVCSVEATLNTNETFNRRLACVAGVM